MSSALEALTAPTMETWVAHAKLLSKLGVGILSITVNMTLAPDEEDMPLSRNALFLVMFVGVTALTISIEPGMRTRWLGLMTVFTLVVVVAYYVLRIHFAVEKDFEYKPPMLKVWDRERVKTKRVLTGFVMTPEAKAAMAIPGTTLRELLLDAAGHESLLWTARSRTALKTTIFILYLLASAGATSALLLASETFAFLKGL